LPLLSFSVAKESVLDGSKEMTIRALRKRPFKVGAKLFLYWKSRTKECEKLGEETCLFEKTLSWDKISLLKHRNSLAQLDGFRDWYDMKSWFYETHDSPYDKIQGKIFQVVCWGERIKGQLEKIFLVN
jgi:hypothetical protein